MGEATANLADIRAKRRTKDNILFTIGSIQTLINKSWVMRIKDVTRQLNAIKPEKIDN